MERIAKHMARRGVGSRRQVEQMIVDGRVTCNGIRLQSPALVVSDDDIITLDGHPLAKKEPIRLWKYYKPAGLITAFHDPEGRPTVFEYLPASMPKVVAVGRLDLNSEGLLLLTNAGSVAHYLEKPSNGLERTYRVRTHGHITKAMIKQMSDGVTVDGIHYAPITTSIDTTEKIGKANIWLTMTLTEGKNREIRRVLEYFGLSVNRLIRTAFGSFTLGDLKSQQCVEVPLNMLKQSLPNDLFDAHEKDNHADN